MDRPNAMPGGGDERDDASRRRAPPADASDAPRDASGSFPADGDELEFPTIGEVPEEDEDRWDADDERRQRDCFAPPKEPCECYCLHCGRTFSSEGIWFQRVIGDRHGLEGFWMCPTPNCSGAGFTFDIFPTDPDHPANAGWHTTDDDEDGEGVWTEEDLNDGEPEAEYDPDESKYKQLDDIPEDDEDLEGEEWKYGLEPGQRPEREMSDGEKEWLEEQKRYDMPDERPRELDWTGREERRRGPDEDETGGEWWKEDDIPF